MSNTRGAGVKPYHLFTKLDEHFVYDTSSSKFFHIDALAYELLALCQDHTLEVAQTILCERSSYSKQQVADAAVEIEFLKLNGFFGAPTYRISTDEIERQLERRYTEPWTKLELALAETCNLACKYCYCSTCRDLPDQGLMPLNVAKRAIEWLFAVTGKRKEVGLTLFGGEPLLNREVFQFIMEYSDQLAREHGKKINYTMTTNGTLLDDMSIDYIKKHNFGLMVSLDGPAEVHDNQCPFHDGTGSFDAAAGGIKRLMKRRRAVTVRCTMSNAAPRMLDLINFFEEFGFTRIVLGRVVNPVNPSPVDCTQETFEEFARQEDEELLPWMLEKLKSGQRPKYFPYSSFLNEQSDLTGSPELSVFKCGACRGTMTVGADGKLYPCHRYVGMEKFVIGHVDQGPDLDKARQYWRDYHKAIADKCNHCWARYLCKGPCPWEISNSDGTFRQPDDWGCTLCRSFFERAAYVQHILQRDNPAMYDKLTKRGQSMKSGKGIKTL